jgi:hypothetical protein
MIKQGVSEASADLTARKREFVVCVKIKLEMLRIYGKVSRNGH